MKESPSVPGIAPEVAVRSLLKLKFNNTPIFLLAQLFHFNYRAEKHWVGYRQPSGLLQEQVKASTTEKPGEPSRTVSAFMDY